MYVQTRHGHGDGGLRLSRMTWLSVFALWGLIGAGVLAMQQSLKARGIAP